MGILHTIVELIVLGSTVMGAAAIASIFWFVVLLKVCDMDADKPHDFLYCMAMSALLTACTGVVAAGLFLNFFV